jgi:hypothetical protein
MHYKNCLQSLSNNIMGLRKGAKNFSDEIILFYSYKASVVLLFQYWYKSFYMLIHLIPHDDRKQWITYFSVVMCITYSAENWIIKIIK